MKEGTGNKSEEQYNVENMQYIPVLDSTRGKGKG